MALNLIIHALIVLLSAALPVAVQVLTGANLTLWIPLVTAAVSLLVHWLTGMVTTQPAAARLLGWRGQK